MSSSRGRGSCAAAACVLGQEPLRRTVFWVDEREHPTQLRHEELVELELLGDDVSGPVDPRQVRVRMGQALHEAVPDRV